MSVFVCGDVHGSIDLKKLVDFEKDAKDVLTKDDYVIICGDFGMLFNWTHTGDYMDTNPDDGCWDWGEIQLANFYEKFPWTTLFVDGNHENFDRLDSYPVSEMFGGKVQKITDSVYHLMRGEIYTIEGKTYFTFGGAMSVDRGIATYTEDIDEGVIWWRHEIFTKEEKEHALQNLEKHNHEVDYIITHDCPAGVNTMKRYKVSIVSNFLEEIRYKTKFKHWFCGHMHVDEDDNNVSILYNRVLPITYSSLVMYDD